MPWFFFYLFIHNVFGKGTRRIWEVVSSCGGTPSSLVEQHGPVADGLNRPRSVLLFRGSQVPGSSDTYVEAAQALAGPGDAGVPPSEWEWRWGNAIFWPQHR